MTSLLSALGLPLLGDSLTPFLASLLGCTLIYQVAFLASPVLFPRAYKPLKPTQQANWNIHIVSMLHCCAILPLNYYLVRGEDRFHGDILYVYDKEIADVCALSLGYFIWDAAVSIRYAQEFGFGFCLHGIACSAVFLAGYTPFLLPFGPIFLLFEASTPFLNIHWFMDKAGANGSTLQALNGMILLVTFFLARIVYGSYHAIDVLAIAYRDRHLISPLMWTLLLTTLTSLMGLNFVWFYRMVSMVHRRFFAKSSTPSIASDRAKIKAH